MVHVFLTRRVMTYYFLLNATWVYPIFPCIRLRNTFERMSLLLSCEALFQYNNQQIRLLKPGRLRDQGSPAQTAFIKCVKFWHMEILHVLITRFYILLNVKNKIIYFTLILQGNIILHHLHIRYFNSMYNVIVCCDSFNNSQDLLDYNE